MATNIHRDSAQARVRPKGPGPVWAGLAAALVASSCAASPQTSTRTAGGKAKGETEQWASAPVLQLVLLPISESGDDWRTTLAEEHHSVELVDHTELKTRARNRLARADGDSQGRQQQLLAAAPAFAALARLGAWIAGAAAGHELVVGLGLDFGRPDEASLTSIQTFDWDDEPIVVTGAMEDFEQVQGGLWVPSIPELGAWVSILALAVAYQAADQSRSGADSRSTPKPRTEGELPVVFLDVDHATWRWADKQRPQGDPEAFIHTKLVSALNAAAARPTALVYDAGVGLTGIIGVDQGYHDVLAKARIPIAFGVDPNPDEEENKRLTGEPQHLWPRVNIALHDSTKWSQALFGHTELFRAFRSTGPHLPPTNIVLVSDNSDPPDPLSVAGYAAYLMGKYGCGPSKARDTARSIARGAVTPAIRIGDVDRDVLLGDLALAQQQEYAHTIGLVLGIDDRRPVTHLSALSLLNRQQSNRRRITRGALKDALVILGSTAPQLTKTLTDLHDLFLTGEEVPGSFLIAWAMQKLYREHGKDSCDP